jgi:hypothetical protein
MLHFRLRDVLVDCPLILVSNEEPMGDEAFARRLWVVTAVSPYWQEEKGGFLEVMEGVVDTEEASVAEIK